MMSLTRFARASLGPNPSYIHFARQKYGNKFSSRVSSKGSDKGADKNFSEDPTKDRIKEEKNSLNERKDLASPSVQPSLSDGNRKSKQNVNIQDLIKKLKLLQKGSKSTKKRYIMDKNIAETLVYYLKRDLGENDILVESSPGLGLLTETLLTETKNIVIAYEPNSKLRSNLEKTLLPQHSSRLQIQSHDFEKFYGYYITDQRNPEKPLLHDFLSPMLRKVGINYLPVKIVGVIYHQSLIAKLIFSFTFQCSLYNEISPDLYFYIPYNMYCKIAPGSHNIINSHGLQFQYYFDLETLHVAPKESFYPIYTRSKKRNGNEDGIYLVKISPKKDFFEKVPRAELENFLFFVNTMSRLKRADSLITGMERWIPDCGPELIKNGFHVFAHPKELTPEQLLLAYKIFTSLPSYQESIFHYQRQQFVARFGEKVDGEIEDKTTDEIMDMEDHAFLET